MGRAYAGARSSSTYQLGKDFAKAEQEADAAVKKWPDDREVHIDARHACLPTWARWTRPPPK